MRSYGWLSHICGIVSLCGILSGIGLCSIWGRVGLSGIWSRVRLCIILITVCLIYLTTCGISRVWRSLIRVNRRVLSSIRSRWSCLIVQRFIILLLSVFLYLLKRSGTSISIEALHYLTQRSTQACFFPFDSEAHFMLQVALHIERSGSARGALLKAKVKNILFSFWMVLSSSIFFFSVQLQDYTHY